MSVFQRVHMPSLDGATGWLNSDPLGPAELRGRVVLANFWTLTCVALVGLVVCLVTDEIA